MLKEIVEVAQVLDDKVKVRFTKNSSCSCCRVSFICHQAQDTLLLDGQGFSLKEGDKIEVEIDERKTMLANLIVFLLPVIIFISSLILFKNYGEAMSFFLAMSSVCIYYVIVKVILKVQGRRFKIRILRKV